MGDCVIKDDNYYKAELLRKTKEFEEFLKELGDQGYEYSITIRDQNAFDTVITERHILQIVPTKLEYVETRTLIEKA